MLERDKKLFGEALLQALAEKYDEELAACTEDASCSERHLKRMEKIIGVKIRRHADASRRKKSLWIAIVVAAALLLVGCTVYTYRKQIGNFIEDVFENYFRVSARYDDSEGEGNAVLTEFYTLSYVPEGYELVNEIKLTDYLRYEWKNEQGDFLRLEQLPISNAHEYGLDDTTEYTQITTLSGKKFYYRYNDNKTFIIWTNEKYIMSIVSTAILPQEVLNKIIDNIEIKKQLGLVLLMLIDEIPNLIQCLLQ